MAIAVANANQVGIAALADAAVGAIGTGAVVQTTDHGPLGFHQGFDLKAQVVEEGLVVLPEGLLVEAVARQQAHAFEEAQAQPGLQPSPQAKRRGEFAEGLGGERCERFAVVELTAGLPAGFVQQGIGVKFQRQRTGIHQSFVEVQAVDVFGSPAAVEGEGVTKVGVDGLPVAPGGHGQGIRMPIRDRRNQGRAGHGLRCRCHGHGWNSPIRQSWALREPQQLFRAADPVEAQPSKQCLA